MKNLGHFIAAAPDRLRTRVQGNLVAAADEWNKAKDQVLGVQGSRGHHAPAGTPPFTQSGMLRNRTRAVASASELVIHVYTTVIGKYQDEGTTRMGAHPFLQLIATMARPAMLAALRKPGRKSIYQ